MSDLDKAYFDATSVDINEQIDIWNERGKGYYGEYMLFSDLYKHVNGQCKILMNLNIPVSDGKTTEIDCLLIHESGVYVFECKHYKGTIYGKYEDIEWTQYFRTSQNSHFPSPVKQNAYHIEALRKLLPQVPIRSFVVFTNSDTQIKVTGWENTNTVVCRLSDVGAYFKRTSANHVLSAEQISEMFDKLFPYTSAQMETVVPDKEPIPFVAYYSQLQKDFTAAKESLKVEIAEEEKKKCEKRVVRIKGLAIALVIVVAILALVMIEYIRRDANSIIAEYKQAQDAAIHERDVAVNAKKEAEIARDEAVKAKDEMAKKFKNVEPMNGGSVKLADNFLEAYVKLEMSKDLKDTALLSCKIQVNGEKYALRIDYNSKIIVRMKDGSVSEYKNIQQGSRVVGNVWGWSKTHELSEIQIYTKDVTDIEYIKLTNVAVVDVGTTSKNVLPGIEFELYSGTN